MALLLTQVLVWAGLLEPWFQTRIQVYLSDCVYPLRGKATQWACPAARTFQPVFPPARVSRRASAAAGLDKTDCSPPPGTPQGRPLAPSHRQCPPPGFRTPGRHRLVPLLYSLCPKDQTWLLSVF